RRMSTSRVAAASIAPATMASGARSPPIASTATVTVPGSVPGDPTLTRSLDLDDLPAAVPAAVHADRVRQPRRAAVGTQRVRRGRNGVVRRTPGPRAGPAGLALRDSQRRLLADRKRSGGRPGSQLERPEGRPAGIADFFDAAALDLVPVGA